MCEREGVGEGEREGGRGERLFHVPMEGYIRDKVNTVKGNF